MADSWGVAESLVVVLCLKHQIVVDQSRFERGFQIAVVEEEVLGLHPTNSNVNEPVQRQGMADSRKEVVAVQS